MDKTFSIGLVLNVVRDPKGHRDYDEKDVAWVEFLKRLKATGMPLNMMKTFARLRYRGDAKVGDRIRILEAHYQRVSEKITFLDGH